MSSRTEVQVGPSSDSARMISEGVTLILQGLGIDLDDRNFKRTPERVMQAYQEIFKGLHETDSQIAEILSTSFPCEFSEMILQKKIRVYSVCPHHLLPVVYDVAVAYIPEKGGEVLGLSKLARLVEVLAKRPALQEQFTSDVTRYLMQLDGCTGAACIAEGQHFCMMMRGARQDEAVTTTSSVKGVFMDEPATKAEFLSLVRG
jgi:GTP cyclohydrolase I